MTDRLSRPETKMGSDTEYCFHCGKDGGHRTIVCDTCGGCHSATLHDLPRRGTGIPVFEPSDLGYLCPKKHRASQIQWSEFEEHIWCCVCEIDYPSKECLLQCPKGDAKHFNKLIKELESVWGKKPNIIEGILEIEEDEWN